MYILSAALICPDVDCEVVQTQMRRETVLRQNSTQVINLLREIHFETVKDLCDYY